jgi:hypothetical protein
LVDLELVEGRLQVFCHYLSSKFSILRSSMATLTNITLEGNQKFSGKNYNTWKQRMLAIFAYRCLSDVVMGTRPRPMVASKDQDKFDGQDREVVMLIKLSVTDEMLPEVQNGQTVAVIWKQLKETHKISDKGRVLFLNNMLFSIKMSEGASLQHHLLKIKDIREQLEAIGQKMEKEDMVVITLNNLPRSYEHFIETLNIIATDVDLNFGELSNKLLQ